MKALVKINLLGLFSLGLVAIASCKKDPGNYTYRQINEAVVTGLDSIYVVNTGENAYISPQVTYTQDKSGDTTNYRYDWLLTRKEGASGMIPKLLDSGRVFKAKIDLLTGVYDMLYRITDKRTGVWKEYPFKLFVTLKTYEGWLLLSEIAGQRSRLDMMSYQAVKQNYVQLHDVLSLMKSNLKLTGMPNFVCFNYMNLGPNTNGTGDKIMVGTTKEAAFLGADTLNYSGLYAFGNYMNGPDKATDAGAKLEATNLYAYLTVNGAVYYTTPTTRFTRVSKLIATGTLFKAAPFVSFTQREAIVFDEDNSRFLWCPRESSGFYTMDIPALNNMNKSLMFMTRTGYNGEETFAILKDKTDAKVYLARFTSSKLNYLQEITGTSIAQAENIAVNGNFGYVFYNVGSKIYEYDFSLGLNKQMADYGTRQISLLKFQNVQPGAVANIPRYNEMRNQLIVCSYQSDDLNSSGTMDLYDVPPVNAPLIKVQTFTGLGKVVSVTYRSR